MSPTEFAVPVEDRYFEDYVPGAVFEYSELPVTEAEIVEFARRFDPQDTGGWASVLGIARACMSTRKPRRRALWGLIASGWHTAAMRGQVQRVENASG